MFETRGVVNEKLFRELGMKLLPVWYRRLTAGFIALLAASFVLAAAAGQHGAMLSLVICGALAAVVIPFARSRSVKTNLQRMRETTGRDEIPYAVRFEDGGIDVENEATGALARIPYESVVSVRETPEAFALFTKANQLIPVFKAGLADSHAFLDFLCGRPTSIKRKKRR